MGEKDRTRNTGIPAGDPTPDGRDLMAMHKENASRIVADAFMDVDKIFALRNKYAGNLIVLLGVPSTGVSVERYSDQNGSPLSDSLQYALRTGRLYTEFTELSGTNFAYELTTEYGSDRTLFTAHLHAQASHLSGPEKVINFKEIRRSGDRFIFDIPSVYTDDANGITEYRFFDTNSGNQEQVLRIRRRSEAFDLTLDYEGIDEEGTTRLVNGQIIELKQRNALWRGKLWVEDGFVEWDNAPDDPNVDIPQVSLSIDGKDLVIQGVGGAFGGRVKGVGLLYDNDARTEGPSLSFPVSGNLYTFLRQALNLVPVADQIEPASQNYFYLAIDK